MFSQVCVHPHPGGGGGGLPHLHPIILPLVICPFWGYPSDWFQVPSRGTQVLAGGSQVLAGGTHSWMPPVRSGWGIPPARTGVPPGQVRMGYPHPARSGWGTPQPGLGSPPPRDRLCLDRLCHGQYTSCGFPQKYCLVLLLILSVKRSIGTH